MTEFEPLTGINREFLTSNPSREEFEQRLADLFSALRRAGHKFDTALIIDRVNQYYFTGTMQDGILVLRSDGNVFFFVRKSYDRALFESSLDIIRPMSSYRDLLKTLPADLGSTYVETEIMPLAVLERLRKYFTFSEIHSLDRVVSRLRSVKSEYELGIMRESGRQHNHLLQHVVPGLMRAGMSEAELQGEILAAMVKLGYQGVTRFAMFQMEILGGQVSIGESGIFPSSFNGPVHRLPFRPLAVVTGCCRKATWCWLISVMVSTAITVIKLRFTVSDPGRRNKLKKRIRLVWMYSGKPANSLLSAPFPPEFTRI